MSQRFVDIVRRSKFDGVSSEYIGQQNYHRHHGELEVNPSTSRGLHTTKEGEIGLHNNGLVLGHRGRHINLNSSDLLDGVNIGQQDVDGTTPLMTAVAENLSPLVLRLLSARANVNAQTRTGRTALHFAAECGHDIVVSALLEARADHSAKESRRGATPLHVAAACGHVKVCALLLMAGADINSKDDELWPPIFWAAEAGHTNVVTALVSLSSNYGNLMPNSMTNSTSASHPSFAASKNRNNDNIHASNDNNINHHFATPPLSEAAPTETSPPTSPTALINSPLSNTHLDLSCVDRNGWRPALLSDAQLVDNPLVSVALVHARQKSEESVRQVIEARTRVLKRENSLLFGYMDRVVEREKAREEEEKKDKEDAEKERLGLLVRLNGAHARKTCVYVTKWGKEKGTEDESEHIEDADAREERDAEEGWMDVCDIDESNTNNKCNTTNNNTTNKDGNGTSKPTTGGNGRWTIEGRSRNYGATRKAREGMYQLNTTHSSRSGGLSQQNEGNRDVYPSGHNSYSTSRNRTGYDMLTGQWCRGEYSLTYLGLTKATQKGTQRKNPPERDVCGSIRANQAERSTKGGEMSGSDIILTTTTTSDNSSPDNNDQGCKGDNSTKPSVSGGDSKQTAYESNIMGTFPPTSPTTNRMRGRMMYMDDGDYDVDVVEGKRPTRLQRNRLIAQNGTTLAALSQWNQSHPPSGTQTAFRSETTPASGRSSSLSSSLASESSPSTLTPPLSPHALMTPSLFTSRRSKTGVAAIPRAKTLAHRTKAEFERDLTAEGMTWRDLQEANEENAGRAGQPRNMMDGESKGKGRGEGGMLALLTRGSEKDEEQMRDDEKTAVSKWTREYHLALKKLQPKITLDTVMKSYRDLEIATQRRSRLKSYIDSAKAIESSGGAHWEEENDHGNNKNYSRHPSSSHHRKSKQYDPLGMLGETGPKGRRSAVGPWKQVGLGDKRP